jgi:deazaflavin-dependent oxidoreductase (nitroreductase family)
MEERNIMAVPNKPELPAWIKDHLTRYIATDGEDGYLWDASLGGGKGMIPTLLLTTIGRKSGNALTMPLIYGQSGPDYVLVASKGGAPEHPAWYLNLQSNPQVGVQIKGDKFAARARTATGAEREALWRMMVEIYAPYAAYQQKTDRQIPVVILERAAATSVKKLVEAANAAVPRITPSELKKRMAGGNVLVVDVRDHPEIATSGNIKGAVHVTRGMLDFRADPDSPYHDKAFYKDRTVVLYCASGGRAALCGKLLKDFGYANVYNLGAFKDWAESGGDVEKV